MTDEPFTILYLYPQEMSFYGDGGNVLALRRRLEWRGFSVKVIDHHIGQSLPKHVDIIIGGGGQDIGQLKIHPDLMRISQQLLQFAQDNVPMLMVCGLYQLFGQRFVMANRQVLPGVGIFAAETLAYRKRLIGNAIIETKFGEIVGFENHSGQTILDTSQAAFGTVKKGYGNDESGDTDGAVYKHVYGTYLHGAILPKNPSFADALIEQALINRYGKLQTLAALDDSLARRVHAEAHKRKG